MATSEVYTSTTVAAQQSDSRCFTVPSEHLTKVRFCIKVVEVLLSFVAFVLEEVVNNCMSCAPLYFFEFVSCTAFLFTLLLLILLSTQLHTKVGITCWPHLDFGYTLLILVFFVIASIAFVTDNSGTKVENAAVLFGFLASGAFLADVVVFIKTRGVPCLGKKQAAENPAAPVPEVEKLNANGNESG
ncbi:CKLF-like MARVEL transmembrane domain-containing protein 6 [Colossoma macropomum]|uniref:CKLF-like MARVEL transmembrane domain-containing protein 6 n=1 Tax=Colossoma macropomum TaxID=42526 RepID=UPI0018653BB8|nr:CKLF-like MARVEL transmembrane domain-containing protein 6 [Colossoma macropomum]